MAEQYRFFDHIDGDRLYNADEFAEYFRQVLTSGVLNGGSNLQVYCNGADRIARIKSGKAWLEGYFYKNTEELQLQLDEAHGTYDRIDRIVLKLDRNPQSRYIKAFVKTGVPAMAPAAPALTRDSLVYEISLAQILVVHNTTVIPANKVTDERLNAAVCGLVNSLIQVDTAEMQAEFDAFMATLAGQGYATVTDLQALLEALNSHKADNTAHGTATKAEAQAGTSHASYMTPLRTKEAIQALQAITSINSKTGAVTLAAADVGAVPTARTVNGKALSANISLNASDVGAAVPNPSIVTVSASKNLALTDAATVQNCTNAAAITITIPTNATVAFLIGTEIAIIRSGAGTVAIAPASGVTLNSKESKRNIDGQHASCALKKIATDTWVLVGALTT